jgi:hypothetical protein
MFEELFMKKEYLIYYFIISVWFFLNASASKQKVNLFKRE